MNILIEKATKSSDCENISNLASEIWYEHYPGIISAEQINYMLKKNQTAFAIEEQINSGICYYIAGFNNAPAGYFAVRISDCELFINKLYIVKSMRGKGIATAFINRAKADFPDAKNMKLYVNKYNPSVNAYLRMGFNIVRSMITDIGDGYVMDDYEMVLHV